MRRRSKVAAALVGAVLLTVPAWGAARVENRVPSAAVQEMLIKIYLLALNDADLTGNYTVLQARLAKPFREQFDAARLKKIFKSFNEKKVDFSIIAAKPPIPTSKSRIDDRGALILRGYFDTEPTRVLYDLAFIPSEHKWKPIKIEIHLKRAHNKK